MKYLYAIEASFFLKGVGKIITTTFAKDEKWPQLKPKDKLILERPDGSILETEVVGFELVNYRKVPERLPISIKLPKDMEKHDIPEGTKVYKEEKS